MSNAVPKTLPLYIQATLDLSDEAAWALHAKAHELTTQYFDMLYKEPLKYYCGRLDKAERRPTGGGWGANVKDVLQLITTDLFDFLRLDGWHGTACERQDYTALIHEVTQTCATSARMRRKRAHQHLPGPQTAGPQTAGVQALGVETVGAQAGGAQAAGPQAAGPQPTAPDVSTFDKKSNMICNVTYGERKYRISAPSFPILNSTFYHIDGLRFLRTLEVLLDLDPRKPYIIEVEGSEDIKSIPRDSAAMHVSNALNLLMIPRFNAGEREFDVDVRTFHG